MTITNETGAAPTAAPAITSSEIKGNSFPEINPTFDPIFQGADPVSEVIEQAAPSDQFPDDIFPDDFRQLIAESVETLSFPQPYICASILYALSVAIGTTHMLKVKGTWLESCLLFLAIIGRPGANKSHPLTFALSPIFRKDQQLYEKYEADLLQWEADTAAHRAKSKDDPTPPPPKPLLRKFIISDTTPEARDRVLKNNPRGLGAHHDELAGWTGNMNRYNGGSELETWLSIWSGKAITVDRIDRHLRIDRPFVSVAGTIQPKVLDDFGKGKGEGNGFLDRILFVWMKDVKRAAWTSTDINPELVRKYGEIIDRLLSLDFTEIGSSHIVELDKEASRIIYAWQAANSARDNEVDSDAVHGISAKIETYVLRFCLILQILDWATTGAERLEVSAKTARSAIRLAEYFKGQALHVSQHVSNKNPIDRLPELKQQIYRALPDKDFSRAEAIAIAAPFGMASTRTVETWLKDASFFKQPKYGTYRKIYPSGDDVNHVNSANSVNLPKA